MGSGKLRRALGAVKDHTSIGLAKVSTSSSSVADLEVAIVKSTRHDEFPAEEKHIQEIISLTSYSRANITVCIDTLSRRLNKTQNWTVALKTLILIQRLLAKGDPAYKEEIFFATRRGTRFLNMSDFRDMSRSNSWDYSAFVRTYALYLDEQLEYRMLGRKRRRGKYGLDEEEEENGQAGDRFTPVRDMKNEQIFSKMQHLQQLLERFLACKPTGRAKNDRVIFVALYPIVKESFRIYNEMMEIMATLVDRFTEMEIAECIKVYEIFAKVGKQFDELEIFYAWCKNVGIARTSEYPEIERITQKKLDLMDDVIRDRVAAAKCERAPSVEPKNLIVQETEANEPDMNSIKALPPPEGFCESTVEEKEEPKKENTQQQDDLLNLGDDVVATGELGDELAWALFDGGAPSVGPDPTPKWEAFGNDTADWESSLVQSASGLSNQKTTLAGGLDMWLFNGMYQQGATAAARPSAVNAGNGSASSVMVRSADKSAMLALPAPPAPAVRATDNFVDPFAASLTVAPPPYVQMSDLEKKQRLLVDEQLLWQQYTRDGMRGQFGMANLQANTYNMGSYTRSY
ncbi:putative clathrin assembly protein At1g03050 [Rhodamnia argentea]|uniref:Clathrin assembly protein At1g03050 n=1 Tax=Rhodamnia argentea TaxID=178133 RepID=A0A8B8QVC9_9MYRT|nr:putative clathrin assembly protein At1g03050 [Rhodamnia argentea]